MSKLADRELPNYTKGEEIFNMVSHITGGVLAVAALVLCVVKSAISGNPWAIVSSSKRNANLSARFPSTCCQGRARS